MGSAPVSDEERAAVFRGTWLAAVAKLGLEVQAPAGVEVDWSKQGVAEQAVMRAEAVPVRRVWCDLCRCVLACAGVFSFVTLLPPGVHVSRGDMMGVSFL